MNLYKPAKTSYALLKDLCACNTNSTRGDLIIENLKHLGGEVQIQNYGSGKNIIVKLPGYSKSPIALCAHYDRVDKGEGAIDNGASCVELLDVFEQSLKKPEGLDVTFIFFDEEEKHQIGSRHYVQTLRKPFSAVYNLDVTGKGEAILLSAESWDYYKKQGVTNDVNLNRIVRECCGSIPCFEVGIFPGSDNVPFIKSNMPATAIAALPKVEAERWKKDNEPWTLPTVELLHTENDTYDQIEPSSLKLMMYVLTNIVEHHRM